MEAQYAETRTLKVPGGGAIQGDQSSDGTGDAYAGRKEGQTRAELLVADKVAASLSQEVPGELTAGALLELAALFPEVARITPFAAAEDLPEAFVAFRASPRIRRVGSSL